MTTTIGLKEGDRVEITGRLPQDPNPLDIGDTGTVMFVDDLLTAHCDFDSGRKLGLLPGDPFIVTSRS